MFDTVTAIQPHVKSGAVRALAVTTATRSSIVPDVPTMAETKKWERVAKDAGVQPE